MGLLYSQPSKSFTVHVPLGMYGELIKGKQTSLLLFTTLFAYLISAWGGPLHIEIMLLTLIGTFFAVSGSTLLNMYIDRDIDAIMERTKERATASGRIHPGTILLHGIVFTVGGTLAVGYFVNFVTMAVVFAGFFFDVVVYSLLLKRRTKLSILFGGIAGGMPALAGRTAILGVVDEVGVLMALFVVLWVPVHILTLAMLPKNLAGYRNASVPMWPVVSSKAETSAVITVGAILAAVCAVAVGELLNIHWLMLLPLLGFALYLIFLCGTNLWHPTFEMTFKIFKLASMLMVITFLWLYIGLIGTGLLLA